MTIRIIYVSVLRKYICLPKIHTLFDTFYVFAQKSLKCKH